MRKKEFNKVVKKTEKNFYYDSNNFSLPRFPTIYQLHLPKQSYTRQYDCFYELYYENDELLKRDDIFLYNYTQSLANRGFILRLKEFASFVRMDYHKMIDSFDRLEDCLLIHRVNRSDLQGKANDLVVHLPATPSQWKNGLREKIIRRVECNATRLIRSEKQIEVENKNGDLQKVVPRHNGKFHFSYKDTIKRTFKKEADAELFSKDILKFFQTAKNDIVKDVKKFDEELRRRVRAVFESQNKQAEERHYKAALTMRKIYAPVMSEFLA